MRALSLVLLSLTLACRTPTERATDDLTAALDAGDVYAAFPAYAELRVLEGDQPALLGRLAALELREGSVGVLVTSSTVVMGDIEPAFEALLASAHPDAPGARMRILDELDQAVKSAERNDELGRLTGNNPMASAALVGVVAGTRTRLVAQGLATPAAAKAIADRYRDDPALAELVAAHDAGTEPEAEPDTAALAMQVVKQAAGSDAPEPTTDPVTAAAAAVAEGAPDAVDRLIALVRGEGPDSRMSEEEFDALEAGMGQPLDNLRALNELVALQDQGARIDAALGLTRELEAPADRTRVYDAAVQAGDMARVSLANRMADAPDPAAAAAVATLSADGEPAVWGPAWRARCALGEPDLLAPLAGGMLEKRSLLLATLVLDVLEPPAQ